MATTINNPGVVYDWAAPGATTVVGPASATDNAVALFNGTTGKLIKNSTVTWNGTVFSVPSNMSITGAAGSFRSLGFQTAGVNRFLLTANNTAEGGANAGSDFQWRAYDDAGSLIDFAMTLTRASGGPWAINRPFTTASGRIKKVSTVTDTVTLDSTYHHVRCNKATAMTVNLPAAASNSGREYYIKNINVGVVTIDANASETIDGATTYALSAQYQSVLLVCNGTSWDIY